MGCLPSYQGTRLVMDCATCGLGLTSSACLDSHLHTLATLEAPWKTMRYEEETIVALDEEKSKVFSEYVAILRQIEQISANPATYGRPEDERVPQRQKLLKDFYSTAFQNPMQASMLLKDYQEPTPERAVFYDGWRTFQAWVNGIRSTYEKSRLFLLSQQDEDLRQTFVKLLGLKSTPYSQSFLRTIPTDAKLVEGGEYELAFGIRVKVYEIPNSDTFLYVQENPLIDHLPKELADLMQDVVSDQLKALKETVDYATIFDNKMRTFRQQFMDLAALRNIPITPQQALAMGREAAAWTVGLGSPIENLALDRDNLTDVYIDAPNAAIYLEHQKFGLCHTTWQYNQDLLERAFRNITTTQAGSRKFDKDNPVIDVVLPRLAMRCHLQRPPATFGDLQAALRIMKEQPFTYSEYLNYHSFTPFFAGYDDVMVGLGCSEAVLGLKGVGKTAFTSAKISAIGPKRRILPIQDIEEIPVRAYRKRGFHIGAVRVLSSEREEASAGNSELDLVSMTNAALRMGDACVIINEIRSRTAIQGVINMLNTQPGIFLLYNLHAQSLKDIQDRLELVFGLPAASMYSTDRYSFLKKVRFGRKSRVYRMMGQQYETDIDKHQFVSVFEMQRADDLEHTVLRCLFCDLPEASAQTLADADLAAISRKLKLKFIPPALKRRADETGLPVNDYVMEAFYKGKLYDLIRRAAAEYSEPLLLEVDFVLKCLNTANRLLKEREGQDLDWAALDKRMESEFSAILKNEQTQMSATAQSTGSKKKEKVSSRAMEEENKEGSDDSAPAPAPLEQGHTDKPSAYRGTTRHSSKPAVQKPPTSKSSTAKKSAKPPKPSKIKKPPEEGDPPSSEQNEAQAPETAGAGDLKSAAEIPADADSEPSP